MFKQVLPFFTVQLFEIEKKDGQSNKIGIKVYYIND
jgi:hypothetical protein